MKKCILVVNLIIINLILLSSICYGIEFNSAFFQTHNKSIKRETGYFYIESNTSLIPIEKVVKTNKRGTVEETEKDNEAIYYLKDFTSNAKSNDYTQSFDLSKIEEISDIYKSQLPQDETKYNELMWVINNVVNVNNKTAKVDLLSKAGLSNDIFKTFSIGGKPVEDSEKDIIESIQQAAIYYFANDNVNYIPKDNANIYIANGEAEAKVNLTEAYKEHENAVEKLYNYLINQAKINVKNGYRFTNSSNIPVTLDTSKATVTTVENNNLIGPYIINQFTENEDYTVTIYGDKKELSSINILGEDGKTQIQGNTTTEKIKSNLNKSFYISIPSTSSFTKIQIGLKERYNSKSLYFYSATANKINSVKPVILIKNEEKNIAQYDEKEIAKPKFDLALRAFIQTVNGKDLEKSREPSLLQEDLRNFTEDKSTLNNGMTVAKKQTKSPVSVNSGDKVVYTIRVYNEGQIDGEASEIVDYIPEGLELVEQSEINQQYNWKKLSNNMVSTDYLKDKTVKAFDKNPENKRYKLDYQDVQIELKVTAQTQSTDTILKNVAEIKSETNEANEKDRDSNPANINNGQLADYNCGTSENGLGYEDDDDYDAVNITGKYFDLALRQFITKTIDISNKTSEYKREPNVDVEPLLNGKTDATYKTSKGPVAVEIGDTVVYTLRVYNEGQIEGYADEITEHLPEELEYVNDEFNAENGWIIDTTDATQRTLKTTKLSKSSDVDNKIAALDSNEKTISYKDIQLKLKTKSTATTMKEITAIAEITKSSNDANIVDRDNKKNVSLPSDKELSNYRGNEENKQELSDAGYYYKGQEDDDDFEKVILQKFDLALRAFETKINNEKVEDRIPTVDKSKFETTVDGRTVTTCTYTNKKDTINVCQNDKIEMTIRVYNEGTQDGYAQELKGILQDGITFDENDVTNKNYGWKLQDGSITTDYLSKEKNTDDNIIKAYDKAKMGVPTYKEVKVVLVISEPTQEGRDRQIQFEISKTADVNGEKVTDIDSVPNEWNENEDDQDFETIHINTFDLKINQTIEKTIIIEDGKEKVSNVKNKNKENVLKVEINKNELENVVIKFQFKITIENEGEIAGYASEISDYLPTGLKFNQADNQDWKEYSDKITTNKLNNTIINPGESISLDLTLTWINDESNMKLMSNVVEISEIRNNSNTKDIDSTPNNKQEGEDDLDKSEVTVVSTAGTNSKYILIISIALAFMGGSIFLIKKFVL